MKGPVKVPRMVTVCPVPRAGPVGGRVRRILSAVPGGADIWSSPVFRPIRSVGWRSPGSRLGPELLPLGMVGRAVMPVVLGLSVTTVGGMSPGQMVAISGLVAVAVAIAMTLALAITVAVNLAVAMTNSVNLLRNITARCNS